MNVLFICHRPYHVVRSSQILQLIEQKYENVRAYIITCNVYNYAGGGVGSDSQIFNSYAHLFNYGALYQKHIEFDRSGEPRIWNIFAYVEYHRKTIEKIRKLLLNLDPIDNVFFFSDKEKPIEMMVSLAKEIYESVNFLVDEGLVTYDSRKFVIRNLLKRAIIWVFRLRNISRSFNYGQSNLFDYSLSSLPEKSVIQSGIKFKLPVLDNGRIGMVFKNKIELPNSKFVLYVSSGLGWSYFYKNSHIEIDFLNRLVSSMDECGYRLTIKVHPNEPLNRYSSVKGAMIVSDPFVPAELLFSRYSIVLSQYSSTLLNAKLCGVPCACLVKLIELRDKGSDVAISALDLFCPSTWGELMSFVKTYKPIDERPSIPQDEEFTTALKNKSSKLDSRWS